MCAVIEILGRQKNVFEHVCLYSDRIHSIASVIALVIVFSSHFEYELKGIMSWVS